jgi:hypothetical protein
MGIIPGLIVWQQQQQQGSQQQQQQQNSNCRETSGLKSWRVRRRGDTRTAADQGNDQRDAV